MIQNAIRRQLRQKIRTGQQAACTDHHVGIQGKLVPFPVLGKKLAAFAEGKALKPLCSDGAAFRALRQIGGMQGNAFLSRLTGCELTLEFVSFYRYQMARYLRSKPVFTLSLPEGDMISDLIRDAYDSFLSALESSPFNVTGEGRENLLESVRICFPWQSDPDSLSDAL